MLLAISQILPADFAQYPRPTVLLLLSLRAIITEHALAQCLQLSCQVQRLIWDTYVTWHSTIAGAKLHVS